MSEIVLQVENESSAVLPKRKSENAKLLDDTLEHLSGENTLADESDAGPKAAQGSQTSFQSKTSSQSSGYAEARQKFEKFGPTVKTRRPVANVTKKVELESEEDPSEAKHTFVRLRPTNSGKVGSLASSFAKTNGPSETVEAKRPPFANLKSTQMRNGATPNAAKSNSPSQSTAAKEALAKLKPASTGGFRAAPPSSTATAIHAAATAKKIPTVASSAATKSETPSESTEAMRALAKLKARSPPASAAPTPKPEDGGAEESTVVPDEEGDEAKNRFVQLKKVQRDTGPNSAKETELSKIQLKKSTRTTPPVSTIIVLFH